MSQSEEPQTKAGQKLLERGLQSLVDVSEADALRRDIRAIEQEAELLDAVELARVHCDALHSATHTPKLPRPCISSQDQMKIVADAHNAAR